MTNISPGLDDFLSIGNACWWDFLPNPRAYYAERVSNFAPAPSGKPFALGLCPFHEGDDAIVMLTVDLNRGEWRCSAGCGCGDIVEFHMRKYGVSFEAAVREMILLPGRQK
jgi:hypothetical protein